MNHLDTVKPLGFFSIHFKIHHKFATNIYWVELIELCIKGPITLTKIIKLALHQHVIKI